MPAPGAARGSQVALLAASLALACAPGESPNGVLTAAVPLHLEEHLDAARVEGSALPAGEGPEVREWRFDRAQPEWKVTHTFRPAGEPARVSRIEDALRIVVDKRSEHGGIHIDLPDWRRHEWAYVVLRARSRDVDHIEIAFNLKDRVQWESGLAADGGRTAYRFQGEEVPIIRDGQAHDYVMRADWSSRGAEAPIRQLGIEVGSHDGTLDILSVTVLPKEAAYRREPVGITIENRGGLFYRSVFTHTPSGLAYRVRVPENGQLDVGLGAVSDPVTFRVAVGSDARDTVTVLEETHGYEEAWAQRRVDLEPWAGETVTLSLETESERDGATALWAAPTLTGVRATEMPNIIFYVIDGAGADFMSVYGYNRRTTPNLERLAAEGAVFEHAYSNSSWTKPSTRSFMTSLHDSVLGGLRTDGDPLPEEAVTLAEHLHGAGYQTGVFTSNPWAGRISSLDRGVDVLREGFEDSNTRSSAQLHDGLWSWREDYPGEPYWAHFQTTDVHMPYEPPPPFAGLYLDSKRREAYYRSRPLLRSGLDGLEGLLDAARALHDESMAHNDYQLGRLVERLRASGEWENTILIVASDHGLSAGGWSVFSPLPAPWGPIFTPFVSRIPLIVVWPGRIEPGQRFLDPVSMIDVLPTMLDLAGLPVPEIVQGQSLAPLLLGEQGWEPRPVILDEFRVDAETGELSGRLEMIDGRWGASLAVGNRPLALDLPGPEGEPRPAPLLIYDLWNDPYCLHSLHDERPDLVEKYATLLEQRWAQHRELGRRFTPAEAPVLDPEQLRNLRSLGYLQ